MRRFSTLLLALVLTASFYFGLVVASPSAQAAPPITPSPTKPMTGEKFTITGTLKTKVVRPVELQALIGKKWKKVGSGKSDRAGRYSLTGQTTRASLTVRVVAKRTRVKKRTYAAITTQKRVIKTTGQTASLSMPATVEVNGEVTASLTFSPVRTGRPVELQALLSGGWTKIASGFETANGTSTIQLTATTAGAFSYRAVAPSWRGATSVTSQTSSLTVKPSTVVTRDVHPISDTEAAAISSYDPSTGQIVFAGAPASLAAVTAGTVITLQPRDSAPSGALRKVTKVVSSGQSITFDTVPAALTDAFASIPAGESQVGLSVISSQFTPGEGVTVQSVRKASRTVKGAGVRASSLGVLSLKVGVDATVADHYRWAVDGQVSISIVNDCAFQADASGLRSYRLGAGLEVANEFTSKVGFKLGGKKTFELGRLTEVAAGTIGVVPVWLQTDAKLILEISAEGEVGVVTETTQSGISKGGIENTSGSDLTPKVYSAQAESDSKITQVALSGKATAFFGGEVDLSIYSLVGPFGRLGAQAEVTLEIPLGSGEPWKCELVYGPHAEIGLKTNDDLEKFLGVGFKAADELNFLTENTDLCPAGAQDGQTDMAITPTVLPDGHVGEDYATTLGATGGAGGNTWVATGLPDWLSLDAGTGALTSTGALVVGSYPLQVKVTDMVGATKTADLTLKVVAHKLAATVNAGDSSCLIDDAGKVWCWGGNQEGELGAGSTEAYSTTPVKVTDLSNVTAIGGNAGHTCAITTGHVKCWGGNNYGQLGDGPTDNQSSPVSVPGVTTAVQVAGSDSHTCALLASGRVTCWGDNSSGELGDGTITPPPGGGGGETPGIAKSDVSIAGSDAGAVGPVMVKDLTDATAITVGSDFSCALRAGGSVQCWGYNGYGQLGDGTTDTSAVPVAVQGLAGKVVQVDAGWYNACALLEGGTLQCWGPDRMMQATPPTTLADVPNLRSVSVGSHYGDCGLTTQGTVSCWGENVWGQYGNGSVDYNLHDPAEVSGLSDVVAVSTSGDHVCAVTSDGTVKCWGANFFGALGDGSTTHSSVPVGVVGFS